MRNKGFPGELEQVLVRALEEEPLGKDDIIFLLNLTADQHCTALYSTARSLRERYFGSKVFLYGFVYFSTYCRNDCSFCFYRRSNSISSRYRKSAAQILETAEELAESGAHLVDLTMGEDPLYHGEEGFDGLLEITAALKKKSGLPVMISPGIIPRPVLKDLSRIGVDWYACYQETHNRDLFEKLRLNQDYDERMALKYYAHELGMLCEEGLLAGVGESSNDIYDSLLVMENLLPEQVRVMSFIPQAGTPLENYRTIPRRRELLIMAVMRLLFPDRLIPASLDVDGISGLKARLQAGANVVTSIIPPGRGLCGVSQSTLDIGEGNRSVAETVPILKECGLQAAQPAEYRTWVEAEKVRLGRRPA